MNSQPIPILPDEYITFFDKTFDMKFHGTIKVLKESKKINLIVSSIPLPLKYGKLRPICSIQSEYPIASPQELFVCFGNPITI